MKKFICLMKNNKYLIFADKIITNRFALYGFVFLLYFIQFIPLGTFRAVLETSIYFLLFIVVLRLISNFIIRSRSSKK